MKDYIIIFWVFIPLKILWAQDSLQHIQVIDTVVMVNGLRNDLNVGHHIIKINLEDEVYQLSSNLSDLLSKKSTIFIKNYGPSNIATLSNRGGNANHTNVIWEGVNIQHKMLGLNDLSILPAFFSDNIQFQYGGNAANSGNGSLGGTLLLNSHAKNLKGFRFEGFLEGGSFERWAKGMKIQYGNRNYYFCNKVFVEKARNNFPFFDLNGIDRPIKEMVNGDLEKYGVLQEHYINIHPLKINFKAWYQYNRRSISPSLLISSSNDQQIDATLRFSSNIKYLFNNNTITLRQAVIIDRLDYFYNYIESSSNILNSITGIHYENYLSNRFKFLIDLGYDHSTVHSDNYSTAAKQDRISINAGSIFTLNKFKTHFNIRTEWVDERFIRPAVSTGGQLNYKNIQLSYLISYNYRIPTLNDLYWLNQGNPALLPEYSFSSELGFHFDKSLFKNQSFNFSLVAYSNLVDDWIIWVPDANGIWRPENISQVWTKGIECSLGQNFQINKFRCSLNLMYTFTHSNRTRDVTTAFIGKKLIYIPEHQLKVNFGIQFKAFHLELIHTFISERFIDEINESALPYYNHLDLYFSQKINIRENEMVVYLKCSNLLGEDYQVVAQRPMPWQQFTAGIRYRLQ